MLRLPVIATLAVLVAACGSGGEQQPAPAKDSNIVVRSSEQDQLHQFDDMYRDIAMKRAITASGFRCKRVVRSGYVTEHGKLSMWSASCEDKRSWAVFVGPDGTAQVRPCPDMVALKLPECRITEDPSGRTARGIAKQG
jgi:hypothetical protein